MVIDKYYIDGYWWILINIILIVIILMAINGYFVIGYWCLLMIIILMAISGYFIGGYLLQPHIWESARMTFTFPKMGTWESSGTSKTSELNCKGQNTSSWGVLHIIGKLLKCRYRKWPCIGHLDTCSTSYGQKKGWESNWQFDSRPLKVGNRPDLGVCKWSATHRWKALKEATSLL